MANSTEKKCQQYCRAKPKGSQKAVSAYFTSNHILRFGFAEQHTYFISTQLTGQSWSEKISK